jgi:peptidoglycan/xylan/chitin deacetylase (PgdA/CDA1 family)
MAEQRGLVEEVKHRAGKYGGFTFGGQQPDGVSVHHPLRRGTVFPGGAKAAVLLTFDVEGTYGNAEGDVKKELSNFPKICSFLARSGIPATFNVIGQMAEELGPDFLHSMIDAGCEVASHGYVHDLNKLYGGDRVYAGHYGLDENTALVMEGVAALDKIIRPSGVRGIRFPYGHFNEYSYNAVERSGLSWTSNVGIDDFVVPGQGYGPQPFQMKLGEKIYPIVEIPLDSQTFDWPIWIADENTNGVFVGAVKSYCEDRGIPFVRTPKGAVAVWKTRIAEAVANNSVLTLLCHPIYLTIRNAAWGDPVKEFLFPVIEILADLNRQNSVWVCTCSQMAEFYRELR